MTPQTQRKPLNFSPTVSKIRRPFCGSSLRLVAFCCVVSASCVSSVAAQQPPQEDRIEVMAVVNGSQITRQQLSDECLQRYGEEVLESLVNKQLVVNEAQRYSIQVSTEQIQEEIERIASKWGLSVDRWLGLLRDERNISPTKYREFIWTTLTLRELAKGKYKITPEEVDRLLESEVGPKVQARLIVCNSRKKAEEILELVRQNPDTFGRTAREHSVDTASAANSGMIAPIRKHSSDPQLEEAAFGLEEGEISEVLEIKGQFLILRCEQQLPPTQISSQQEQIARQRIVEHLQQKKLEETADRLFEKMQQDTEIVNVHNNPELHEQYPGVAALVGNMPISLQQLAEECIARHGIDILEGEINRVILQQELARRGLEVAEEDIRAEIARAAEAAGMMTESGAADLDRWLEYITSEEEVSVDLYVRDAVWPSVALKLLVQGTVQVTDEDMSKAFEANFGERVEALAIVLQDQRTAQKVWKMAQAQPTPQFFGELANTYSTEPASQANYGRVPPIERFGGRPRLEEEAFLLEPGEISGLINIGENWIILMCLGRTEPVVTDSEDETIRQELYNDLYEKKMRLAMAQKFRDLKEASSVDNFLLGTSSSPRGQRAAAVPAESGRVPFRPAGR